MIRVKPDWVLAARSLGSLDARMTARWVLGSQGPGFPGEDSLGHAKVKQPVSNRVQIQKLQNLQSRKAKFSLSHWCQFHNANLLPKLFRGPYDEVAVMAVMAEVASKDARLVTAGNIGFAEAKERDGERRQRFQESECHVG